MATSWEAERAARLLGAAEAMRQVSGTPIRPIDSSWYERTIRAAREALGDHRFSELRREGQAMTVDEVTAKALELPEMQVEAHSFATRRKAASTSLRAMRSAI